MTIQDPKRLIVDEGATAFERHWLSAAQAEDLPADVASKIEHSLGIGAAPAVPAPVPAAVTTAVKGGVWGLRLAGLSALGVTGTVGLVMFLSRTPSAPSERPVPAVTATSPAAAPAAPVAPPATVDNLADEIAMIDGARTALAAGSPARALALLDRYGARYPQGTLVPEALAMRIEAIDRNGTSGDHARAQSLARTFLRLYPQSPLAQRVAEVARGRAR